jgi:hypothetical protein
VLEVLLPPGSGGSGITAISGGTTFATGPGITFANSNGVSFGVAGNTITASIAAAPAAGIHAISAGTTVATSGTISFADSNGISFGVVGQTVTASYTPGAISFASINAFRWADFATNNTIWSGQASYQLVSMPMGLSGSSGLMMAELLGNSGSSGGITLHVAAYQLTGSTAGAITSRSAGFTWTSGSDTTASSVYGGASGTRYRSFPWDVNMTPGEYLFGVVVSQAGDGTVRLFGRQGANLVGSFVGIETNYFVDGYTNSTIAAFPANVVANNTNFVRTGLSAQRQPAFVLFGTV